MPEARNRVLRAGAAVLLAAGLAAPSAPVLATPRPGPPPIQVQRPAPPGCDTPSADPACARGAQLDPTVLPGGSATAAQVAGYPTKPEAPTPPRGGSFADGATVNARNQLGGKAVYLCNEVVGIDGPSCAGGGPRSDEELISTARDGLGARVLWVRCGDSRRGFPVSHRLALQRLRPKVHAAGMRMVCWDVPNFWDLHEDARRLAEMAGFSDAVASDLESGSDTISCSYASMGCGYAGPELETDKGRRWAAAYSGWVRWWLSQYFSGGTGEEIPLIVITMQPQTHPGYPFEELSTSFNVFSPTAYRGVTWFNNNDPGQGESPRAGNPFVPTGYAVVRARGAGPRHDLITTGMTYSALPSLTAHPNQIVTDLALSQDNGGLGFVGFVFQDLLNHADWAAAFRGFTWFATDAIVPYAATFAGGVNVAVGNVEPGGDAELVTAPGAGGGPHVRVLSRSAAHVTSFFAYGSDFRGGANVASCDVDGDGPSDVVTGAGPSGGPHVRVIRGSLTEVLSFFAYSADFTGGVNVACGDVDGDADVEIVTGAMAGGGPHVRVVRRDLTEQLAFFAYGPGFSGGVNVAAGDVDGDGDAEVITGAGPGGGPHVRVIRGNGTELAGFFAYSPAFGGGVWVGAADVDGDGDAEVITGAGPGGGPHVRVLRWNGSAFVELRSFFPADPGITRGLRVAGGQLVAGGGAELAIGLGPGRPPAVFLTSPTGAPLS